MKTSVIVELGVGAVLAKLALDRHNTSKAAGTQAQILVPPLGQPVDPNVRVLATTQTEAAAALEREAGLFAVGALGAFGLAAWSAWR